MECGVNLELHVIFRSHGYVLSDCFLVILGQQHFQDKCIDRVHHWFGGWRLFKRNYDGYVSITRHQSFVFFRQTYGNLVWVRHCRRQISKSFYHEVIKCSPFCAQPFLLYKGANLILIFISVSCLQWPNLLHSNSYPSKCLRRRELADAEFGHACETLEAILPGKGKKCRIWNLNYRIKEKKDQARLCFLLSMTKKAVSFVEFVFREFKQIVALDRACHFPI